MFWCIAPSYIRFRAVMKCFLATSEVTSYRERFYFDVFWHYSPPLLIHYTNTPLLSKRRSISRVHTENCCLSRVFFFETGSACCYFKTQQALLSRRVYSCFGPVKHGCSTFECRYGRFVALNVDILRRLRS